MKKRNIKIDIVADINCPWCYLGEHRLKRAIKETENQYAFKLHFKPFELNPNAPQEGEEIEQYFIRNYGADGLSRIEASQKHITEARKEEGLTYNFDKQTKIHNTFNCHRLIWLAAKYGVQEKLTDALYKHNFSEGANLSDLDFLRHTGVENGIPAEALEGFFEGGEGKDEVKAMELEAHQAGITGVPAFVLNDKYLISGAQPVKTFIAAFGQLSSEGNG